MPNLKTLVSACAGLLLCMAVVGCVSTAPKAKAAHVDVPGVPAWLAQWVQQVDARDAADDTHGVRRASQRGPQGEQLLLIRGYMDTPAFVTAMQQIETEGTPISRHYNTQRGLGQTTLRLADGRLRQCESWMDANQSPRLLCVDGATPQAAQALFQQADALRLANHLGGPVWLVMPSTAPGP